MKSDYDMKFVYNMDELAKLGKRAVTLPSSGSLTQQSNSQSDLQNVVAVVSFDIQENYDREYEQLLAELGC